MGVWASDLQSEAAAESAAGKPDNFWPGVGLMEPLQNKI